MNYYNENDPFAAAWLRELIKVKAIPFGIVDERSIIDILPNEITEFTQCHFFAGIGVWAYALQQAQWPTERNVWTGSCPCQPFSTAGQRKGIADERHLWPAFYHLIRQCKPTTVFGEQVASKDGWTWLETVSSDLEASNYSFAAADLCAAGVGAPHKRQRLYFMANNNNKGLERRKIYSECSVELPVGESGLVSELADATDIRCIEREFQRSGYLGGFWREGKWVYCRDGFYRPIESGTFPLANGTTNRVGSLRGYGNTLVAPLAIKFIEAFLSI